ncbi:MULTISPECIES: DUF3630 family protein [Pseudomonas]|jgi:hypothetical protein|uniref:DUF3630 family protein n=1 Tax=Pseudomonas TaxID=286 RepID=UPI000C87EA1F|nr:MULTISPECIES: DUF3630 family protein [Pseudomonas]MDR6580080.1 hypothetical protein [Pseudomonas extremaustralis]PMX29319.1 hypothetical protein C1Y23_01875 [Pseudomonas sp. GW460-12]PMX32727.1 hypothetical protein C1Y24_19835 [Pseudomonas sp. MPR-R2A4]PMX40317.1 hypothetical protein C1Y26_15220 [Pseudomonas sp. MPR-R2A7]PMX52777.1 hypothetical protein C1Y17_16905 [Pseudomonas sp. MPR-R2A6]
MVRIEVSEEADWKLFEYVARVLEQGLGGCWKERLDGSDQRYWDLLVDEHTLTLHLEHYLGISVVIPDGADDIAQRVCALLKQPPCG